MNEAARESGDSQCLRRRARWAFGGGAFLSGVVYLWTLTAGSFDLFARQRFAADFYDVQAHRLLSGHLSMPGDVLLIEAFSHAGRDYMYFGPTPALLRMPIALVTDRLDGRLTPLFMLLGFAVVLWFTARLLFRARDALRPSAPWSRLEIVAFAGVAFVVGAGSSVLFLGSRPWVYHEASLWGLACALGAFVAILDLLQRPSAEVITRIGIWTSLAMLARPPMGAGPLLTVGAIALVAIIVRLRPGATDALTRATGTPARIGTFAVAITLAAAIPALAYAGVNQAKFGNPLSIPFDRQAQNAVDPHRQAVLAANGGSLINVAALPTTALAYARPDTVRLTTLFPFVTFREQRATVIGDVEFDLVDREAGIPVTMPTLLLLAVVGAAAVFRRRRKGGTSASSWRIPLIGAAIGVFPTLTIVYVAQRYTADFLPFLLLGSVVGFQRVAVAAASWNRRVRVGAVAALVACSIWGVWTNVALGYEFRHAYAPLTGEQLRADRVRAQLDAADVLGAGRPSFARGPELPPPTRADSLYVLDDCAGLYWSDGEQWFAVERTNRSGRYRIAVTRPGLGSRSSDARVLVEREAPSRTRLLLRLLTDDRARIELRRRDADALLGRPFRLPAGDTATFDVVADENIKEAIVSLDGGTVFASGPWGIGATKIVTGTRGGINVTDRVLGADVCRRLTDT